MVTISLVIPTIPPRAETLNSLLKAVEDQTRRPNEVIVVTDEDGEGVAATRNRGIERATGNYIAFFDDDDVMYPSHIHALETTALETGADLVYPWHDIIPEMTNPLSYRVGMPFTKQLRSEIISGANFIPIPVLVNTSALREIGGFHDFKLAEWDHNRCEILDAWRRLLRNGATFAHCPHVTWAAVRNGENTAGMSWPGHIGTKQKGYDT